MADEGTHESPPESTPESPDEKRDRRIAALLEWAVQVDLLLDASEEKFTFLTHRVVVLEKYLNAYFSRHSSRSV